jgi:hypothetical protein
MNRAPLSLEYDGVPDLPPESRALGLALIGGLTVWVVIAALIFA